MYQGVLPVWTAYPLFIVWRFTLKRILSISSLILGVLAAVGLHAQTLSVDKTSMTFSAQSGGAKVSQALNISSPSGAVTFFATAYGRHALVDFHSTNRHHAIRDYRDGGSSRTESGDLRYVDFDLRRGDCRCDSPSVVYGE